MTRKKFLLNNLKLISKLYNGITHIYGPYISNKDNRRRVVLYDGVRRITRQYCKIKMEIKLGKRLSINETVDHKDRNVLNDSYSNIRVLSRSKHSSIDSFKAKVVSKHSCVWCNTKILSLTPDQRNSKKAGPFCSRSCSGKYGAALQNRKTNKLSRQKVLIKYIR